LQDDARRLYPDHPIIDVNTVFDESEEDAAESQAHKVEDESDCIITMVLKQGAMEKMPLRELEDEILGLLL
jgi:hypothetical protein